MKQIAFIVPLFSFIGHSAAQSVYSLRPDDPHAVYLTATKGDGVGDDADALQNAINRVQETTHQGNSIRS